MKIRLAFTRPDLTRCVTSPIEVDDPSTYLDQIQADPTKKDYGLTLEIAQPSDSV